MEAKTKNKVKVCPHGVKYIRRYNSTLYVNPCTECKKQGQNNRKIHSPKRENTNSAKKSNKKVLSPTAKAREKADLWFSRYIRLKYNSCIVGGEVYCRDIITGIQYHARNMDNGHCFSRGNSMLRYEEDDCRPQNKFDNLQMVEGYKIHQQFKDNLIKEIGLKRFRELLRLKRREGSRSTEYYQETALKYKKEVTRLLKDLEAIKWWT